MNIVTTSQEGVAPISGESIEYRWQCKPRQLHLFINAEEGWTEVPFAFPPTFEINFTNTEKIIKAWIECSPDANKLAFKIKLIWPIDV